MLQQRFDKYFYYDIEILNNVSGEYFNELRDRLKKHENYNNLKDKFDFNEKEKTIVYIIDKIPLDEIRDLSEEEMFFYPLCNKDEIKRIFNPQTANDYLLKLRAENIADDIRLHRLYVTIRKKHENWNFSKYIDSTLFDDYLSRIYKKIKNQCNDIPHGIVHLTEPNGFCEKTPYGNIIVISEALKFFLYYMNLFALGRQLGINESDVDAAFWIAIRILLGFESLDFEIDSRGEIPEDIDRIIKNSTEWQLRFIIGHEYAHHSLGHLDNGLLKRIEINSNPALENSITFYSYEHFLEYEADFHSIKSAKNKEFRNNLAIGAFYFFHFLDLFETVKSNLYPKSSFQVDSHPSALNRLWKLKESLNDDVGIKKKDLIEYLDSFNSFKEDIINNILPFHIDEIETYSSLYLPNYKTKILYDRLDF